MEIQIDNFGPIRHYKFDLNKDLHLIFGKNNIGKSYSITVAYIIVKSFLAYGDFFYHENFRFSGNALSEEKFEIESDPENTKEQISSIIKMYVSAIVESVLHNSLVATFDTISNLQNQFNEAPLRITLRSSLFTVVIGIDRNHLFVEDVLLRSRVEVRAIKTNRHNRIVQKQLLLYYIENNQDSYQEHVEGLSRQLFYMFISEFTSVIESVHYLPASRSGLYQALSAFGQIVAELSKNRAFIKKRIELPGIPEPLSDYFINLSDITVSKKGNYNAELNEIAEYIEANILKGKVEFDSKTKRIMFSPDNTKLRLDLSSTSSMVSELSPIVSYIRYILAFSERRSRYRRPTQSVAKPLVIIEEPEAHLHPEVQVKIMEVFSRLVANNVKMIITTHSNYIFNKCNNLILAGNIDTEQLHAVVFEQGHYGSIGREVQTDNLGMDDENFVDVSETLYDEKLKLVSEYNKKC